MDLNCRNHENDDHQNMYGIRKTTYWEKYCVQRFPYRGKRRYTPLIIQSFEGGIKISNDVFGLTIKQFEKIYKDCLKTRKKRKQWILNLRYLDKSSNEYLEYLQNGTDCNEDKLTWQGNDFKGKCLLNHLLNTVGTEIDIRTRQRLFIVKDMIYNECLRGATHISSGSLAEGLDLPGSDIDVMLVIDTVNVLRNVRNAKHPIQRTTAVMETESGHPGFTRLKLVSDEDGKSSEIPSESFEYIEDGLYLSVDGFISQMKKKCQLSTIELYLHGPCLSDKYQSVDWAFCLRCKYFPYQAIPWAFRYRQQWPSDNVINRIIDYGCLLVPIGPRTISDNHLLWRLSFSVAEKVLVHSFNITQLLCYGLLKLTLKRIINTIIDVKDLLCSYFFKTALFWVSEEVGVDTFELRNVFVCFSLCLKKIILWVNNCYCPNYFIPEHNMFLGKITTDNSAILLHELYVISFTGIDGLIKKIFQSESMNYDLSCVNSNISRTMLDFLCHKSYGTVLPTDIESCYKVLTFTEHLLKSESTALIIEVCKYYCAQINQCIAQLLPFYNTNVDAYTIHLLYHKHLQDGINIDSVSGWLLYASFYYVTGQYNVTLKLTDYILSRGKPDMVYLGIGSYSEEDINNYKQHVHNSVTLNDRMKLAMVGSITYMENSPLIPEELQLEVEQDYLTLPPIVMSHCLRFLCFHHLEDISKRKQALQNLYLTVKKKYFISEEELSTSFTILGICYEISGDKDTAYQWYDASVQCDGQMWFSTKKRISKLFEI